MLMILSACQGDNENKFHSDSKKNVECHYCHKKDHLKFECWKKQKVEPYAEKGKLKHN